MERTANEPAGSAELPEREVTPNMLIGLNMTRWRVACGMTQDQVGERLGGWTKNAVSAAERSWDGKRVRQFDADLIVALAEIFGVPAVALFMPPDDEGTAIRYMVKTGNSLIPVGDFFSAYVGDTVGELSNGSPAARAYEEAFIAAMAKYKGSWVAEAADARLSGRVTDAKLEDALAGALESHGHLWVMTEAVQGLMEDNELLRDLLLTMLRGTEGGRAHLEERDRAARKRILDDLRQRGEQHVQEHFIDAGRELFGRRGPRTREEWDRAIAKGYATQPKGSGPPYAMRRLIDGLDELPDPRDKENSA